MEARMDEATGRTAQMQDAANAVREPHFHVMHESTFHPTSLLDNLKASGNGYASVDRQRMLMGINRSAIGQSDSTFDQSIWLKSARPAPLYNQINPNNQ